MTDRTIKVVVRADKNPASTGYRCTVEAFDVNGIVGFPGIGTEVYGKVLSMTTNSNGYAIAAVYPPDGYSFVGYVGGFPSGLNSAVVKTPHLFVAPVATYYSVILDEGQASTSFTVKVYFLIYPNEPWTNV